MGLNQRAQQALSEMYDMIDSINVDDLKSEGLTIRQGNKLVKLEVVHEEDISIEDEIRHELAGQLSERMEEIKKRLNQRLKDALEMADQVKRECERKERELRNQIRNKQLMPDITEAHAKRGISVVKGDGANSYIWLVRGVYWPKYYITQKTDDRGEAIVVPIKDALSKRMMSEVVFMICTSGDKITKVTTRKPITLEKFDHYHQRMDWTDCWGHWKPPATWKTIDDLIRIGKEAQAVLESVNANSMANDNPRGLPRRSTIERNGLEKAGKTRKKTTLEQEHIRMGVTENDNDEQEDVWTT